MRNDRIIPPSFVADLKSKAFELGFTLCGIAPASDADHFDQFANWLDHGFHGEMDYLAEKRDQRKNPKSILNSVQSVIMVGWEYNSAESNSQSIPTNSGRVARYAQGPDYHKVIWAKLNLLSAWIESQIPGCQTEPVADTAPLLERDFARRAGLGWTGKNTMMINPKRGSYFFLGAVLTNLELECNPPFETNHCGNCTACLDACPTVAFPEPGILDATKCISYLTIELKNNVPDDLRKPMGNWLFGCDICQEVCPWNRFAGEGTFPHDSNFAAIDCIRLLSMTDEQYRLWFRGTSFFRTKRSGLLRNAAIVLGNTGNEFALPALNRAAFDEDEVIRDAAKWALQQIERRLLNENSSLS